MCRLGRSLLVLTVVLCSLRCSKPMRAMSQHRIRITYVTESIPGSYANHFFVEAISKLATQSSRCDVTVVVTGDPGTTSASALARLHEDGVGVVACPVSRSKLWSEDAKQHIDGLTELITEDPQPALPRAKYIKHELFSCLIHSAVGSDMLVFDWDDSLRVNALVAASAALAAVPETVCHIASLDTMTLPSDSYLPGVSQIIVPWHPLKEKLQSRSELSIKVKVIMPSAVIEDSGIGILTAPSGKQRVTIGIPVGRTTFDHPDFQHVLAVILEAEKALNGGNATHDRGQQEHQAVFTLLCEKRVRCSGLLASLRTWMTRNKLPTDRVSVFEAESHLQMDRFLAESIELLFACGPGDANHYVFQAVSHSIPCFEYHPAFQAQALGSSGIATSRENFKQLVGMVRTSLTAESDKIIHLQALLRTVVRRLELVKMSDAADRMETHWLQSTAKHDFPADIQMTCYSRGWSAAFFWNQGMRISSLWGRAPLMQRRLELFRGPMLARLLGSHIRPNSAEAGNLLDSLFLYRSSYILPHIMTSKRGRLMLESGEYTKWRHRQGTWPADYDSRGSFVLASRQHLHHEARQLNYLTTQGVLPYKYVDAALNISEVEARLPQADVTKTFALSDAAMQSIGHVFNWLNHVNLQKRLAAKLISRDINTDHVQDTFLASPHGVHSIEGLLSQRAMAALRRFLVRSTIWFDHAPNVLTAHWDEGLAGPLLQQLDESLQSAFPRIFAGKQLVDVRAQKFLRPASSSSEWVATPAGITLRIGITSDAAHRGGAASEYARLVPEQVSELQTLRQMAIHPSTRCTASEWFAGRRGEISSFGYKHNRALLHMGNHMHRTRYGKFKRGFRDQRVELIMTWDLVWPPNPTSGQADVPLLPAGLEIPSAQSSCAPSADLWDMTDGRCLTSAVCSSSDEL